MQIKKGRHTDANTIIFTVLLFLAGSALLAQTGGTSSQRPPEPKTLQFVNGQWFDGRNFAPQTFYSVKGLLTRKKPDAVDATIDLHNGFVVPPFGDAHNHMFDGDYNIRQQVQMYLFACEVILQIALAAGFGCAGVRR